MVQRYEQMRILQWYKRGAAYDDNGQNALLIDGARRITYRLLTSFTPQT